MIAATADDTGGRYRSLRKFGCVVVGDSAVTIGTEQGWFSGRRKFTIPLEANIGFAIWGNACLAGQRVDELHLPLFVNNLPRTAFPRSAGQDLAALLIRRGYQKMLRFEVGASLRGGVHVCGLRGRALPVLFHIHTGPELPAPQAPFQPYEDFPDARHGAHLRNGYYPMFGALFQGMEQYVSALNQLGFTWPHQAVEDQVLILLNNGRDSCANTRGLRAVGGRGRAVSAFAYSNRNGSSGRPKAAPEAPKTFCQEGAELCHFLGKICP